MSVKSKIFSFAILSLFLACANHGIERADAATIPSQCQQVLDKYRSGITPKTDTPLQRHSALYMYERSDQECGWGTWNNNANLAVTRNAALARCQKHDQRDALVPCTLVGEDGIIVESGVARFSSSATAAATTRVERAASRQTPRPTRAVAQGNAPAGGDALYSWCRHAVFVKYGRRGSEALAMGNGLRPGQKAIVMLESTSEPMIAYCMQQGGKSY